MIPVRFNYMYLSEEFCVTPPGSALTLHNDNFTGPDMPVSLTGMFQRFLTRTIQIQLEPYTAHAKEVN